VPVPEPELQILDDSTLAELLASVDGDTEFVVQLIETYLADAPQQLSAIDAASAASDAAALVRPAHTLKSSSATVGAQRLAALSRRLEAAGRSGTLEVESTRDDLAALPAEWTATAEALRGWVARGADA
jgi:HPt (histidine-containing phosphotransfer) domain-containing protein